MTPLTLTELDRATLYYSYGRINSSTVKQSIKSNSTVLESLVGCESCDSHFRHGGICRLMTETGSSEKVQEVAIRPFPGAHLASATRSLRGPSLGAERARDRPPSRSVGGLVAASLTRRIPPAHVSDDATPTTTAPFFDSQPPINRVRRTGPLVWLVSRLCPSDPNWSTSRERTTKREEGARGAARHVAVTPASPSDDDHLSLPLGVYRAHRLAGAC